MHRSRSASSSSVRCGCQYFQSNDPLPEKKSLIGTPPSSRTPTMGDHEYEPITPKEPPPPAPILKVSEFSEVEKRPATPVPQQRYERRYIKIPNEDAVIIPLHGDSDEEINPDRYVDKELTVQEIQDKLEEKFFTTTSPPSTTETKMEEGGKQSSQVAESAEGGGEVPTVQEKEQSHGFQTSLKNQAGRFRNKLRNISAPKISLPERPKLKLPERPKIKLPDRPKIKFPDRPKIKLPDRPKFLQEKPKFLTERPKFLSERPKFLRERPKFHLPERPKFHLPERPKFHLPERFKSEKPKKGPRPKKPNPSSTRRPLRDVVTVSSQSGSTGNIFHTFKFKTYPRFLSRKKKEKERSQLSALGTSFETESSLPSTPPENRRKFNPPWVETYRDIKFADDDVPTSTESAKSPPVEIQDEEGYEENTAPFHDSYMPGVAQLQEGPTKAKPESEGGSVNDSDKEVHSSGSSSMRHRAGVLEEIDSDEFFLREKGLSREDVDVSRYLSLEIRDAFRSPAKNALAKLDAEMYDDEYDDEEPEIRFSEIPKAPERRKPTKVTESVRTKESDFHTFPMRPSRRKQSDPSDFARKEPVEKPPRKYRSKSDTRQQGSLPSFRRSLSQGMDVDVEPPLPPKRRKSSKSLSRSIHESATDFDAADMVHRHIARGRYGTPVVPLRKSRSRGTSLAEEDRTSRGADSTDLPHDDDMELQREKMEIQHETLLQAKPAYVEESAVTAGYAVVMKPRKKPVPPRPPPPPTRQRKTHRFQSHLHNIRDQGVNFFFTYPRRAIKSLHKPPIRPIRNYSTVGPSRPPRRARVFREPVYVEEPDDKDIEQYLADDITTKDEHEVMKDLQSGEVVERMKGRPLPPPPRPPRKGRDDEKTGKDEEEMAEDVAEEITEETVQMVKQVALESSPAESHDKPGYIKTKRDEILSSLSKINPFSAERRKSEVKKDDKSTPQPTTETSQQTSFELTEVSVSIQTDPLPEGYIVEDAHSELEIETASQRSQSTIGDHTRLDQRQQTHLFEREIVVDTQILSSPSRERRVDDGGDSAATRRQISHRDEYEKNLLESREESPPPLPERSFPSIYPKSIPVIPVFPEKLHISELDVEKLSVNELQASKVTAQEIDANSLNITKITSKCGNLIVNGIELPPDFIENLAAQIQERLPPPPPPPPPPQPQQYQPQLYHPQPQPLSEPTPAPQVRRMVTPPPSILVQHSADVVELPTPHKTDPTDVIPKPKTTRSKGRKSPTRVIDDSEDELASILPARERRERREREYTPTVGRGGRGIDEGSQTPAPPDEPTTSSSSQPSDLTISPTAMQLIGQLLVIWKRTFMEGASTFMEGVNALFPEGEKRRDAQTAACILIVLIAGLILIGFGIDNSVHHHHWDYVPPR